MTSPAEEIVFPGEVLVDPPLLPDILVSPPVISTYEVLPTPGPRGPKGDPGLPGDAAALSDEFIVDTPTTVVIREHGLPFDPIAISATRLNGNRTHPSVTWPNVGSMRYVRLEWPSDFAGTVRLS